jgi:serine/threonine-protein kinase
MTRPLSTERKQVVPDLLGGYRIIREIGRGGMAVVYLADDPKHGRVVAIKVLHAPFARFIGRERFLREIEIAASLAHPHILPLHDSGEVAADDDEPILYFVSPFVDGCSLHDVIQRDGPLTGDGVVRLGREIALALDYAHRQGVVHLDIKPANVLLQDGHAVIADFGIAQAMSNAGDPIDETGEQMIVGTPAYMSPEQIGGIAPLDGRSDIYSLGCVLYEMATGKRFAGAEDADGEARMPEPLRQVIVRAVARERDQRYASAADLARALAETQRPLPRDLFAPRWLVWSTTFIVAAGAGLLAFASNRRLEKELRTPDALVTSPQSIAVLPFANAAGDSLHAYFSDGVAQELIARLSKSSSLRVTPARSAFRFRGDTLDVAAIGRALHVAYVLRGSARVSHDSVYVSAQLLRAADGRGEWASSYARPATERLPIRDDIADRAAKALNATLLANALNGSNDARHASAFDLVLRARYLLAQPTRENSDRALVILNEAVGADSTNAAAWVGLARAYRLSAGEGWIPVADGAEHSRRAARRAIALDTNLAGGYEALAYIQSAYDWDWDGASTNFRRALELEPGNADILRSAALLSAKLGRYDAALAGLLRAVDRDPGPTTYSNLSYVFGANGRWREAEAAARTSVALGPNSILRHFNLGRALLFERQSAAALDEFNREIGENWRLMGQAVASYSLHRNAESDRALATFEAKYASHSAMQIADVYAWRGERDAAFAWLERAYAQRDPGIADLKTDAFLAQLRGDARFDGLMRRLRLPRD